MKLPIFIPDSEVHLKLGKMLLLLSVLSTNKKKEPILTLEKISIFEFLTKHPMLLNRILYYKNKELIDLNNSEKFSIEALFPNRGELFNLSKNKVLLNLLVGYKFVEIKIKKDFEINYYITDIGLELADSLDAIYFKRLRRIYHKIVPISSLSYSNINKLIEPYLNYGIEN
ncbi:ABC-three component system middle component 4 [Mangrovimonas sp. ST2L15]|uniref:ABC-three component system middle component 4 n=1 Tax=Mangrovimonas sp. ST2L15 TaxID=1645916 RepID=UPI0006B525E2|nr:ABC-three component system middle component 4 [Mangrovimonas sp. ST2L15]